MRELNVRPRWLVASALLVAVIFVLSAAGGLAFQSTSTTRSNAFGFGQRGSSAQGRPLVCDQNNDATDPTAVMAASLNLSQNQLQRELDSGRTLAQIIAAQGMTTDQVNSAATAYLKNQLAQAESSGQISSAQAETALASTLTSIEQALNGQISLPTNSGRPRGFSRGGSSFIPCGG